MPDEINPAGTTNQPSVDAKGNLSIAIDEPLVENQQQLAVAYFPIPPAASQILNGEAHTNGGVLLTIPSNGVWVGTVAISAAMDAGLAAKTSFAAVTVQGSTATPSAGGVLAGVGLSTPALLALAPGVAAPGASGIVAIYAGANSATLRLNLNGATVAEAVATGYLM